MTSLVSQRISHAAWENDGAGKRANAPRLLTDTPEYAGGRLMPILSHDSPAPRGTLSPNYGTHRSVSAQGYVNIWVPGHPMSRKDGYAFEHRVIAWDAGLLTDPSQHVHHRNHDKTDNRLENLEVLTVEEHAAHHAREDGYIVNQYGTWPLRDAPRWPEKSERPCRGCDGLVPTSRRRDALYCSERCRDARRRAQKRGAAA